MSTTFQFITGSKRYKQSIIFPSPDDTKKSADEQGNEFNEFYILTLIHQKMAEQINMGISDNFSFNLDGLNNIDSKVRKGIISKLHLAGWSIQFQNEKFCVQSLEEVQS
jgi:hypothetical protein